MPKVVMPDDIEDAASRLTLAELMARYGWSRTFTYRGFPKYRPDLYEMAKANGNESRRIICSKRMTEINAGTALKRRMERRKQPVETVFEPIEKAKTAMNYLRRWGSCYPLEVREPGREGYWFFGREWTDVALIAEAKRRGWVPLDEMELN